MKRFLAILPVIVLILSAPVLWGQAQPQPHLQTQAPLNAAPPLTEKEVITGLKKAPDQLLPQVSARGVDFDMTPEIEKRLRKAKADDTTIDIIRNAGPTARAKAAQAGQTGPTISPEEAQAFSAIRNELDPDKGIALINDFEKKFPNSSLLTYAYLIAANWYGQKNDVVNMVDFSMKSIKLKQDNLPTLMMLASTIPTPQFLNRHTTEKEKYLVDAEKYAGLALKLVPDTPKAKDESDDQYKLRKTEWTSDIHASLGMIHLQRASLGLEGWDKDELTAAENEYKQAISLDDKPNAQAYYRLGEACAFDGKIDDALAAFTKASDLGGGTIIKSAADQQIERLKKLKAAQPPAKQ